MSEPLALFRKGLVSAFGPVASFSTAAHRRVGGPITGHRDRFIRPRAVGRSCSSALRVAGLRDSDINVAQW